MGYVIEVQDHNFEEEVLDKSRQTPVIVDFYATWCGPCQMLAPILQEIAQEYDCVVAKVNTDENAYTAQAFGVEGIPDVKIFRNGEVIDGFVGVLQDSDIRAMLAKHQIRSDLDDRLDTIQQAMETGDTNAAEAQLLELRQAYPNRPQLTLDTAKFYISIGELDKADAQLAQIQGDPQHAPQVEAIRNFTNFQRQCQQPIGEGELDRAFSQACCKAVAGEYEAALQGFIEIVERDRKYQNDGARKAAIAIFNLIGSDNPITKEYRKRLTMALY